MLVLLASVLPLIAPPVAAADDCATIGGALDLASGECRITAARTVSGGSYSIAGPLRITSSGSVTIDTAPGMQASFSLSVAGNFTIDTPAFISGNGASSGNPSMGSLVSIQASGDILLDGNGSSAGGQIRANSGMASCQGSNRAGAITLISTTGNVTLKGGSQINVTGGCLGGEVMLKSVAGNVEIGGRVLSRGITSSTSSTYPIRGGPITVSAGANLTIAGGGTLTSQGSKIGSGPVFDYGADRIHLESGRNMVINGIVQSVGGFSFDRPDILGGINRCTGASRSGKPATPTSCVELWVGGTLTANGGDPRSRALDATYKINGYISARSGDQANDNATCCSWIDIYVMGDVFLNGQPSGVGTNGFMIDAVQGSRSAVGGTITLKSLKGRITTSGRTFIADGATGSGGTGGTVRIEAAGPRDYDPGAGFHPADFASNVDLGDSLQYARGANIGTVGGAGTIYIRSYNGQITGGAIDVLPPGTTITLPAGSILCDPGLVCDPQSPGFLVSVLRTLTGNTTVTLPTTAFVTAATSGATVKLRTGTLVTLPGGIVSALWRDAVITPPAGKQSNPSLTPLGGGCTNRFTGAWIMDPSRNQQFVVTGTTLSGSDTVTGITPNTTGLQAGMGISGLGIPLGTTILSVDSLASQIRLSAKATQSVAGAILTAITAYACDEFNGTQNAGGIGSTKLVVTLCEGWLYNGVTVPLTTTFAPQCGGRPEPPPDVVIPIVPTIEIFGGRYLYDTLQRPATGDHTNDDASAPASFTMDGGVRVAVVPPTAYGEGGHLEALQPLPPVTYVDASNNPISLPVQVGTYTATAVFPGCSPTTTPCGPGSPKTYFGVKASAPIIIYSSVKRPQVTVLGGVYRYDALPHPATGVATTDADTHATIGSPATTVYYNCTWTGSTPPSTASQLVPGPATFGPGCTTTPPVNTTTTKINDPAGTVDAIADGLPVVAYYPGNAEYEPAFATAGIAIWKPRPSVTTATGFTVYYDGQPHPTSTTVTDGGTDGLGGTYPTSVNTVNPGTWTFANLPSGVVYGASPNLSTVHAVDVQAPVEVGIYPVTAVYPGDAIHSASMGTNTIIILPRPVTITVLGGTFLCDGIAHAASGSITYTNATGQIVNLGSPTFTYTDLFGNVSSTVPVYPGTYTVTARLPQSLAGNYAATPATVTTTITITAKVATITATGGTYVWDGSVHGATGSVTYNGQTIGTPTFSYQDTGGEVSSSAPVDIGVYTVTATWPSAGNCFSAPPATTTITIKAPSCTIPTTGPFAYTPISYPAVGASTTPYGLNSGGHIVGAFVDNSDRSAGFRLSGPAGDFSPAIEVPGAASTAAYGVNLAGQIVGTYRDGTGKTHGFLLTGSTNGVGGTFTQIDVPASFAAGQTRIYGINNNSAIVGAYVDAGGKSHGFVLSGLVFDPGTGAPTNLATTAVFARFDSMIPGAVQTVAYGVNNNGLVVGSYLDGTGKEHGFSLLPLGGNVATFVGATFKAVNVPGAAETRVYGVDDAGRLVGSYDNSADATDSFLFDGTAFTVFGALGSEAHGINNVGQIVGYYTAATDACGFLTQAPSLCTSGKCATRTPGFWANHTAYTARVFSTVGIFTVGTSTHMRLIDSNDKLFGALISDISKMTTGVNRSAVDQARMQLLQHLIAAKLNCTGFGCSTSIRQQIANADLVYGGNDENAIKNAIGDLNKYNRSNDNVDPPASLGDQGSSTPDLSQAIADMAYWDAP